MSYLPVYGMLILLLLGCEPTSDPLTDTVGMLQGRWHAEEDTLSDIRFEGNQLIRYRGAGGGEEVENFVVGRSCPDVSDAVAPTGDGSYLFIPDNGRCYFITKLNEQKLQMSLVGAELPVRYVRVADGE